MGATSIGIEHWVSGSGDNQREFHRTGWKGRRVGGFCNYRKITSVLYLKILSNSLGNCKLDVLISTTSSLDLTTSKHILCC